MFRLLRFYSIVSFVSIFLAAAILTLFYRHVTIQWIGQIAERGNLALAQTALNSVKPAVVALLTSRDARYLKGSTSTVRTERFAAYVKDLIRDTSVVRIKVYDREGIVAFSTEPNQIGSKQSHNRGFMAAMDGRVASSLVYRDMFNRYDDVTEEDNMMQSYIPVRMEEQGSIVGVFEIYTDVNQLVGENERNLFIVLAGAEVVLATLYAILVLVVRRAHNIIDAQQQTIQERNATLEMLSSRLLKSEELKKKKIATDLHEGLAQTLSALKLNVESSSGIAPNHAQIPALASVVPILQGAIQDVRSIATELRPPSLDDLGLLPTINWFCREFERLHPGIRIERNIALEESEVPPSLKIVIYRVIESAFKNLGQQANTVQIQLMLQLAGDAVTLLINNTTRSSLQGSAAHRKADSDVRLSFSEMQDRTTLSGGKFTASRDPGGGFALSASWSQTG